MKPSGAAAVPWQRSLPAVIFLVALSLLYFYFNRFKAPRRVQVSALRLETLDGAMLPAATYRGKAVVLNFWAPWCGPCAMETPWLNQLQAAHAAGLAVIGVDNDTDTYADAAQFMAEHDVRYAVVKKSAAVVDVVGSIATLPTTLYIGRSGAVVHVAIGVISPTQMEAYARDALGS